MVPFLKDVKYRIILASSILAVIFFLAYYFGAFSQFWDNTLPAPPDAAVVKDSKIKITADTDLVQKIIYLKCHDEEVFHTKPAETLQGLNIFELQKAYSGWSIDKFDTREVVMSLKVDSLCREHANNMFIGIKDGFVAVYYGKPGPRALLKEVTRISLSSLNESDVAVIRNGLVVGSREELLRTLEGMESR